MRSDRVRVVLIMPRTILVHLNIELPDDEPADANDVAEAVQQAFDQALTLDRSRTLRVVDWCIPLAEEI